MKEDKIIEKLKLDIEERKISYQKELKKIKEEKNLLGYIKGMLDITENNVSNFPYYDSTDPDVAEAKEDFDVMLKYTLKEDSIIASFKAEIKNLYYLEKIGYKHAEQYIATKNKLEEYRRKIKEAYHELITNDTLKKIMTKKEETISKLDYLTEKLEMNEELKMDEVDTFHKCLQCANLSEQEKTAILFSILEKNIIKEREYLNDLYLFGQIRNGKDKKVIMVLSDQELTMFRDALLKCRREIEKLPVIIHFPVVISDNKTMDIGSKNTMITSILDEKTKKILNMIKKSSKKRVPSIITPRFLLVDKG